MKRTAPVAALLERLSVALTGRTSQNQGQCQDHGTSRASNSYLRIEQKHTTDLSGYFRFSCTFVSLFYGCLSCGGLSHQRSLLRWGQGFLRIITEEDGRVRGYEGGELAYVEALKAAGEENSIVMGQLATGKEESQISRGVLRGCTGQE